MDMERDDAVADEALDLLEAMRCRRQVMRATWLASSSTRKPIIGTKTLQRETVA